MKHKIGLVSSIAILVLFGMWYASAGGYEPLIGLVAGGIAVLVQVFRFPARSREQWRTISIMGRKPSEIVRECAGAMELAKPSFGEIRRKGM